MTDTKTCPDCAEAVNGDANVCKHCGWRFDGHGRRAWSPRTALVLRVVVLLLVLLVAVAVIMNGNANSKKKAHREVCQFEQDHGLPPGDDC